MESDESEAVTTGGGPLKTVVSKKGHPFVSSYSIDDNNEVVKHKYSDKKTSVGFPLDDEKPVVKWRLLDTEGGKALKVEDGEVISEDNLAIWVRWDGRDPDEITDFNTGVATGMSAKDLNTSELCWKESPLDKASEIKTVFEYSVSYPEENESVASTDAKVENTVDKDAENKLQSTP